MNSQNLVNNCYDVLTWLVIFAVIDVVMRAVRWAGLTISPEGNFLTRAADRGIKKIQFTVYIEFINGNFISLVCGCFLNLGVISFENAGETFSSIFAIICTIILLLYVAWSFYYLERYHSQLHEESIEQRFGGLYEGLRVEKKGRPYLFHQLVMLRRLLFMVIIFALEKYPII
jgi:hypothetical protein